VLVAEAIGRELARLGAGHVFGVVGSGNFHVTNALVASGARFVAAAHEGGAATMADAYARVSGQVGVLSVHQGPGFTNALTGIAEAAKSRTRLLVLAPEATNPRSNFYLDLPGVAAAVGAQFRRVCGVGVEAAVREAYWDAGTIVLGLPLDVQAAPVEVSSAGPLVRRPGPLTPPLEECRALADALTRAERPVFIAGRGAVSARAALVALAERCGALLAVSAAAKGLFNGDPWNLDVSGGFATPLAASLIAESDLVVAWGSTLNMWTTRHGRLIAPEAVVVQVDRDPRALGANRPITFGVPGDVAQVAEVVGEDLAERGWEAAGRRTDAVRERIAAGGRWRDVSYLDTSGPVTIDPRTLTIALDDLLPASRVVAVDSGNFMGYPSMFLSVPDHKGFCFTQAYQSIGLGLASAVGAALARPDRLPVAALGDGGFLMSVAELSTVVRLSLPMVIVVYNDAAYGAEVHHFGPDGHPLQTVLFPDTDLAAIGRGFGCHGVTVRAPTDLDGVLEWLAGPRNAPLLVDAKISSSGGGSWWLEEAFRGH
jgi:thiamine pyrophosphate-dependent acetolactate synthase large subunit-like protein